jgi:hypothetical protein
MLVLLIVAGLVVAAVVAYKLHKAGKVVTGATVVAAVEADVKGAASNAASAVANTVAQKL